MSRVPRKGAPAAGPAGGRVVEVGSPVSFRLELSVEQARGNTRSGAESGKSARLALTPAAPRRRSWTPSLRLSTRGRSDRTQSPRSRHAHPMTLAPLHGSPLAHDAVPARPRWRAGGGGGRLPGVAGVASVARVLKATARARSPVRRPAAAKARTARGAVPRLSDSGRPTGGRSCTAVATPRGGPSSLSGSVVSTPVTLQAPQARAATRRCARAAA